MIGAVVLAIILGWAFNTFVPTLFHTPEHLLGVDSYSPQELIDELETVAPVVQRNNSLVHFGSLCLAFGLVPMLLSCCSEMPRRLLPSLAGIIAGIVLGPVTYWAGSSLRQRIDFDTLPLLGDVSESMSGDVLVLAVVSVMISLPAFIGMLCMAVPGMTDKAIAVPLAGLVTGLIFPILASLLIPSGKTNVLPLDDGAMLGLWLGLLGVVMILLMTTVGAPKAGRTPRQDPAE